MTLEFLEETFTCTGLFLAADAGNPRVPTFTPPNHHVDGGPTAFSRRPQDAATRLEASQDGVEADLAHIERRSGVTIAQICNSSERGSEMVGDHDAEDAETVSFKQMMADVSRPLNFWIFEVSGSSAFGKRPRVAVSDGEEDHDTDCNSSRTQP